VHALFECELRALRNKLILSSTQASLKCSKTFQASHKLIGLGQLFSNVFQGVLTGVEDPDLNMEPLCLEVLLKLRLCYAIGHIVVRTKGH